jgi:hypothetical protein
MNNKLLLILMMVIGLSVMNASAQELAPAKSPYLAVPRYEGATTKGIFLVNLDNGTMYLVDKLDESADKIRIRAMKKINVLTALGRSVGEQVRPGEILIKELRKEKGDVDTLVAVDTTTGAVAFITGLGDDPDKGEVKQISDKPAEAIASSDANYVIYARHNTETGESIGLYICHLTDGSCLYMNEIQKMHKKYMPVVTDKVCMIIDSASIIEIHAGVLGTRFHLLANNTTGEVYWIEVDQKKPEKLYCRQERVNFAKVFKIPEDTPVLRSRFMMIPLLMDNNATWHVLVVDSGTGKLAMFNVHDYKWLELKRPDENIYDYFPKEASSSRIITAVPLINKGVAKSALLFDNATAKIMRMDKIDDLRKK